MRVYFRSVKKFVCIFVVSAGLAGCSGTENFYSGDKLPEEDTAIFVDNDDSSSLIIDGHWLRSDHRAALLPGVHRIVLSRHSKPEVYGYVEFNMEAARTYSARLSVAERRVWSWAVDVESCEIVAGQSPIPAQYMTPIELGCEREKREIKPENVLLGIALLPVAVVYIALASYPHGGVTDPKVRECGEYCYRAPSDDEEPVGTLLIPARAGGCGFRALFPGKSNCIVNLSINGFNSDIDARSFSIPTGRSAVVFKAGFTRGGFFPFRAVRTDGIALEVQPQQVYALCITTDKKRVWFWIVNNSTGEVVAGASNIDKAPEDPPDYSPYCPPY